MKCILTNVLAILALGFALGLEHAFEPDHVVAVTSLISKEKNLKKASFLGAVWGLGHTTTLVIAGLIIITLKVTIPENIALSLEFLVGIVIVLLGIYVIWDLIKNKKHIHKHEHDDNTHIHFHSHKKRESHNHYHKSFAVGLIHGVAGSASLMLLVLSTMESVGIGITYILLFGIGSMVGMLIVGGLISLPFIFTSKRFTSLNKGIRYATGAFSIIFGAFLMIKISFFEGLFLA
ncbi:MAG: sulfite exporter TauE/SafE family protein [Thermoplasmatales archaeon]|nr:sulfite exporter TauE/SafE family protein [Thermoplasmatales archaeon]